MHVRWVFLPRRLPALCLCAAVLLCLPACKVARIGGQDSTDEVISSIRRERNELKKQIESLQEELKHLHGQVDVLQQQVQGTPPQVPGIDPRHLPRVVRIELHRFSGVVDTNRDDRKDTLRLYVRTLDQHGRFYPGVGEANVQAVLIEDGAEPKKIIDQAYTAMQFLDAYRSGFSGTHYTLRLPLPADLPASVIQLTVKVSFTDAATGAHMSTQKMFEVSLKRTSI